MRWERFVWIVPAALLSIACGRPNSVDEKETLKSHAPLTPSHPNPANGSVEQFRSPVLSWSGGSRDTGDTAVYSVFFDTINPPMTCLTSVPQRDTTITLSGLDSNTTCYWYVVASDTDTAVQGAVWHFTTIRRSPEARMRRIPGGFYDMGSMNGEYWEQPVHRVTISAFSMDTIEVTQGDFAALMNWNPSHFTGDLKRPVDQVTWFDAILYCNRRSRQNGLDSVYCYASFAGIPGVWCDSLAGLTCDFTKNGYRLPTEAEWEYACRAGSTTDYYWGRNYPIATTEDTLALDSNAVCVFNSGGTTYPVAGKKPNQFGLYDMIGNVWEWCYDRFDPAYYQSSPSSDPTGSDDDNYKTLRVIRGASWYKNYYYDYMLRSAIRGNLDLVVSRTNPSVGFRCVRR